MGRVGGPAGVPQLRKHYIAIAVIDIGIGISRWRARLGSIVICLAQRAAGSSAGEPRVQADSMEGMPAGQSTNVVVVLQRLYANGTGVAARSDALRWQGRIDMLIVVVVFAVHPFKVCAVTRRC
jgi:hypothetical protein